MKPEDDPEFQLGMADLQRKQHEEVRRAKEEERRLGSQKANKSQPEIVVPSTNSDGKDLSGGIDRPNRPSSEGNPADVFDMGTKAGRQIKDPIDPKQVSPTPTPESYTQPANKATRTTAAPLQRLQDRRTWLLKQISRGREGTIAYRDVEVPGYRQRLKETEEQIAKLQAAARVEVDPLKEEFRRIFQGKAREELEDAYLLSLGLHGGAQGSASEEELIRYAAEKGLIGNPSELSNPPLPKSSRENEEELERLKRELATADDEGSKSLRERITVLEANRYAFTSHGGPRQPPAKKIEFTFDAQALAALDKVMSESQPPSHAETVRAAIQNESIRGQLADLLQKRGRLEAEIQAGDTKSDFVLRDGEQVFEDYHTQLQRVDADIRRLVSSLVGSQGSEKPSNSPTKPFVATTLLDFLSTVAFDPTIRPIFEFIQNELFKPLPQEYPEITPRIFFWATGLWVESETEYHLEHETVEAFVRFSQADLRNLLEQEFRSPMSARTRSSEIRVSAEMYEVAELASAFATRATGKPIIFLRHFLAMTLKFRDPVEYLYLYRYGLDAYTLISGFAKSPDGDNEQAWKQELQSFTDRTRVNQIDPDASGQSQLNDEELATFRWVVDRRRFSSGMAKIVSRAFEEYKPVAENGVLTGVTPIGIFLALLSEGWTETRNKTVSLPALVVRNLGLNNNQIVAARNRILLVEPLSAKKSLVGPSAEIEFLFDEMSNLAIECSHDGMLAVRHSVAVLLSWSKRTNRASIGLEEAGFALEKIGAALSEHLKQYEKEDKPGAWQSALNRLGLRDLVTIPNATTETKPASVPAQSILNFGGTDSFEREATIKQSCLRVEEYADALRSFFSRAGSGELCFALYGHWGRGKTYLMNKVKDALKKEKYETVFFSAWKHPATPEVWVHLYETLADAAWTGHFFQRIPRLIRTGIVHHGPWPIVGGLFALAFSLYPKIHGGIQVLEAIAHIFPYVGIGGLIWLLMFIMGVRRTSARLSRDFVVQIRHTEKLGLQATIGRDLKALLQGWMPKISFSITLSLALLCAFAAVGLICWTCWYWFDFGWFLSAKLAARLAFTVGVGVFFVGLLLFAFNPLMTPKRVLLVIDDLDRCNPSQLLSVVESIKLLLEDIEISKRVQVAMLVEEDILRQAVHKKYVEELGLSNIKKFNEKRIVDENLEKLFTAHLRLPPLTQADFTEILRKIVDLDEKGYEEALESIRQAAATEIKQKPIADNLAPSSAPALSPEAKVPPPQTNAGDPALTNRSAETPVSEAPVPENVRSESEVAPPPSSSWQPGFVFSAEEKRAFIGIIPRLQAMNLQWGPRSIRAFTFRYQLARLLLRHLGVPMPRASVLMDELVKAISRDQANDKYDSEVMKIVHQVT